MAKLIAERESNYYSKVKLVADDYKRKEESSLLQNAGLIVTELVDTEVAAKNPHKSQSGEESEKGDGPESTPQLPSGKGIC